MAVITASDIQQWLESSKFPINEVDAELEASARELVFSTVSQVYDIATWADTATTPQLIRDAIGMIVASWIYDRSFSEDFPDGTGWATKLYDRAMALVNGIVTGDIDIGEVSTVPVGESSPLFYPTDTTLNEDGVTVEQAYFRMGQVF